MAVIRIFGFSSSVSILCRSNNNNNKKLGILSLSVLSTSYVQPYYYNATLFSHTIGSISGGVNKNTNFQCQPGGSQDDWTYINNIGGSLYTANVLRSGDLLSIHAVVSEHEGTYNCTANGDTSHNILTVLGKCFKTLVCVMEWNVLSFCSTSCTVKLAIFLKVISVILPIAGNCKGTKLKLGKLIIKVAIHGSTLLHATMRLHCGY